MRQIRKAINPFHGAWRDTVSCVTAAPLRVTPDYNAKITAYSLYIGADLPIPLSGPTRLSLFIEHRYRLVRAGGILSRNYRVRTVAYYYAAEDTNGQEILAYHWHPEDRGEQFPHLHLEAGAGGIRQEVYRAHLPTKRVALEDFI